MEFGNLGSTGVKVSRLALGMMTYGAKSWREWVLEWDESAPLIKRAFEAGINFFDTADVYSLGASEEITGRAVKEFAARRGGGRHEGVQSDERWVERSRSLTQAHHAVDRPQFEAVGDGLC